MKENEHWRKYTFPGIYMIIHRNSGKMYIGQSKCVAWRINRHKNSETNKHLKNAINKYGWNAFAVILLEQIFDMDIIDKREQYWIDELNATKNGYNKRIIASSNRGIKHYEITQEHRDHIRLAKLNQSEETRKRISEANRGRKVSDETRRKMSASAKGKKLKPETIEKIAQKRRMPVSQFDKKTGELIATFSSIIEAHKILNINTGHVSDCCNGKRFFSNGYIWRYANNTDELTIKYPSNYKPVYQVDKITNEIIAKFETGKEAYRQTGIIDVNIFSCCNGKSKTAGGYKWCFIDDYEKLKIRIDIPDRNKRQVYKLSEDGIAVEKYESLAAAARNYNVNLNAIRNVCIGTTKTSAGYKWAYVDEYEREHKI